MRYILLTIILLIATIMPSIQGANAPHIKGLTEQKKSLKEQVKDFANCLKGDKDCDPKKVKIARTITAIIGTLILIAAGGTVFYMVKKHKKGGKSEITQPQEKATISEPKKVLSFDAQKKLFSDLLIAIKNNNIEDVISLLAAGADTVLHYHTKEHGATPLHWAAIRNPEIVALLVRNGAELDARDQDDGKTPLYWGIINDNLATVKKLRELGANLTIPDKNNMVPILYARNKTMINYLLEQGATFPETASYIHRILMIELVNNNLEEIKKIVTSENFDINKKEDGFTPLHVAVLWGSSLPIIKYLIQQGADLDAVNNEGETPITIAEEEQRDDVLEYFKTLRPQK